MKYGLWLLTLASVNLFANENGERIEEPREEECEEAETKFAVYGDFLYWKANVEGTELATVVNPTNQSIIFLNGEWKPGFRVGIGGEFGCDEWGLDLTWTYYRGKSENKTVNIASPQKIFADWNDLVGTKATSARGHWSVKLNLLDLTISKWYCISEKIKLGPFVGFRAEWVDLDFRANYFSTTQFTSFNGDEDVKAYGLRAGTGIVLDLWCNFEIVGECSAALLAGKANIKESFVTLPSDEVTPLTPIRYKPKGVHADLEGFLGLGYTYEFDCFCSKLNLAVGYEFSKFFNLNQMFAVRYGPAFDAASGNTKYEISHGGDIDFQGLTVRARLEF